MLRRSAAQVGAEKDAGVKPSQMSTQHQMLSQQLQVVQDAADAKKAATKQTIL